MNWVEVWTQLQALRCVRLLKMGKFAEPEAQPMPRVIGVLQRCAEQLLAIAESSDGIDAGADFVELAWEEYLRDPWGETLTPAYALAGFANATVLQRCWKAADESLADAATLRRMEAK